MKKLVAVDGPVIIKAVGGSVPIVKVESIEEVGERNIVILAIEVRVVVVVVVERKVVLKTSRKLRVPLISVLVEMLVLVIMLVNANVVDVVVRDVVR